MKQVEFIKKMLHKPWVNRSVSWDSVDCYGLVIMYYLHVMGKELPAIDGFKEGHHISECWNNSSWKTVDEPIDNGLVFTCYSGNKPAHVGILISKTKVIHARGDSKAAGKVEIHSLQALKRLYGKITYHQFMG